MFRCAGYSNTSGHHCTNLYLSPLIVLHVLWIWFPSFRFMSIHSEVCRIKQYFSQRSGYMAGMLLIAAGPCGELRAVGFESLLSEAFKAACK